MAIFFKPIDYQIAFDQYPFWIFFFVVFAIFSLIYKHIFLRNLFLTLASFYFYFLSSGYYVLILFFSILVDYYVGKKIYLSASQEQRKKLLFLSLFANLSLLCFFKYAYFFTDIFKNVFSISLNVFNPFNYLANVFFRTNYNISEIALPVGISFYTFQTLSYTIDIYRGKLQPAKNIIDFAFFVSFFPQLVAGPIVRALDFMPQIYKKYYITTEELNRAYFLIIVGLIKKIVISDYLAENLVDRIFESPVEYTGFENLLAIYGYALQIYCDFSGYTDIAIGVALLLGFRLPLNFNSPYKAVNITDFWRRWHISLSSWLRDYLYISLGGNRKGKWMTKVNLMITMLLGGLWHGAHWKFILWGGLHGIALMIHKTWTERLQKYNVKIPVWLARLITFHFICFCWIFFRATDLYNAKIILLQVVDNFQFSIFFNVIFERKFVIFIMLIGFITHFLSSDIKVSFQRTFTDLPDFVKSLLTVLMIILLFQIKSSSVQPFIYFQF